MAERQKKVLLVEDHADTRAAMILFLKRAGYQVLAAKSVAEALPMVDGQHAALLDLNLPDGLGLEVLQHIRAQPHSMRVAFLTAADDPLPPEVRLAADALFRKPVDLGALLNWLAGRTER